MGQIISNIDRVIIVIALRSTWQRDVGNVSYCDIVYDLARVNNLVLQGVSANGNSNL